ncbi:LysM peptidoglycan-binding domain-containing protein, partial [Neoroseomonas rubea]|uniref:LysM peptidoglycan-binding domain-containing protein n=1 Tax=Neoroseomonas rubea TaxID=2748666 RepID=UPI001E5AFFD3
AGSAAAPRLLQGPQMAPEAPRQGGRPAPARLGMSSVDYEEGGSVRFAGTAPAGASVRVYVGDLHAGDAVANAEGRWLLQPERQPPVGRATLRVDQIAERGRVAARVEVPFQRDELPPDAFERNRVVVQPGANLWRIARAVYGRGTRFTVIYAANRDQIRDPQRIFPGQIFAVPEVQATPSASSVSR